MVFIYFHLQKKKISFIYSVIQKKNLEWMFPWMKDMGFTLAKLIWEWIHMISIYWLNFDGTSWLCLRKMTRGCDQRQVYESYSLFMACELRMFRNFGVKYDWRNNNNLCYIKSFLFSFIYLVSKLFSIIVIFASLLSMSILVELSRIKANNCDLHT